MKSSRKSVVYLVLIGLVLLVTAGLILWHQGHRPDSARPMVSARPADDVVVRKEVEKIVTVEKEITADVIQDGLNDVGVLVTEEYYFTEVVGFSSIKKLFKKLELGITESSYLASYDGVVTAGIDFTKITVSKDSELHTVEVRLPKAEILNVDIDPESFELYSEKTGLGNPISAEDFNSSLVELENTASEKAIERGILDRADQNAKTVVKNFIAGLRLTFDFEILPTTKFNLSDYLQHYLQAAQFGYPRMRVAAALGMKQRSLVSAIDFENEFLELDEKMIPLMSSYTQTGDENSEEKNNSKKKNSSSKSQPKDITNKGGRPTLADDKRSQKTQDNIDSKS